MSKSPTVLVADDNRDFCEVAAESLRADGFIVARCSDADSAMLRLAAHEYDAVIVEPSPSAGFERIFRGAVERGAIVAATTEDDPEFITAVKDAGVFCVVRKPLSREQLTGIVKACCAR